MESIGEEPMILVGMARIRFLLHDDDNYGNNNDHNINDH